MTAILTLSDYGSMGLITLMPPFLHFFYILYTQIHVWHCQRQLKLGEALLFLHTRFVIEELHFGGLEASYIDKAFR
jgi:hypothetical protein